MARRASGRRETRETLVEAEVVLDGSGDVVVSTGYGFLDHMVETMLFYAGFDARVRAVEKRRVGGHHVAEDTGLLLGRLVREAAGDRVARYGYAIVPMDEALVLAALDYSGRPGAWVDLRLGRELVGDTASEDLVHFMEALASGMRATLHVATLRAGNSHHVAEAGFKALGMALGMALEPREAGVRSLKGMLEV